MVARTESRWSRVLRRPSLLGIVLATWFAAESLAPSLLVRSWFFQGVLTGISFALGYGIGLGLTRLGVHLWSRFGWRWHHFAPDRDRQVRLAVLVLCLAWATWAAIATQ